MCLPQSIKVTNFKRKRIRDSLDSNFSLFLIQAWQHRSERGCNDEGVAADITEQLFHFMPLIFGLLYPAAAAKSLQSCPTLCDPIDSSPPGSSIHGIFQARVLEWLAITFSIILLYMKKRLEAVNSGQTHKLLTVSLAFPTAPDLIYRQKQTRNITTRVTNLLSLSG